MSCFDKFKQGFFVLTLFLFPRLIFSNVLNMCTNFERVENLKALEEDSSNYVIVPASLMSNFEETNFR